MILKRYAFTIVLLFLLGSQFSFSQKTITINGRVLSGEKVLEGAAVYFNNSMIGTTTTTDGEFTLNIEPGNYELIISYLGYQTIKYKLITTDYTKPLRFQLEIKEDVLNEIIIGGSKSKREKYVYNDSWKNNLEIFKEEFFGKSRMAEYCEILNPKAIILDFNYESNTLKAVAKEPIKIKHNGLGYLITFDMVSFNKTDLNLSYSGYKRYENLEGTKKDEKRWIKNRRRAYKGSVVHFLKSIINNEMYKNGFLVNQFERKINKERPTDEQLKIAKDYLISLNIDISSSNKIIYSPKNRVETALFTLKKGELPKFKDNFYKKNLEENNIIKKDNSNFYLSFEDNINVTFRLEKEERNYVKQSIDPKRRAGFQASNFITLKRPILVNEKGQILNPKDVVYEGYWAFEKFANALPLDYNPEK